MTVKGFDRPRFIRGLILLLLAPVAMLGAFALFVVLANRVPQTAALKTDVWPSVVLPWGQAAYNITFTGEKAQAQPLQDKPVDMLFVMDISSSMTPLLGYVSDVAHDLARQLEAQKAGRIRFALVQFGDNSQVLMGWTAKPSEFHDGLDKMDRSGSAGTMVGDTFKSIDGLVRQAGTGESRVVVLFTDGQWSGDHARQRNDAEALRKMGVDIYCVGIPGAGADPFMVEITGKTERVYNPTDTRDLALQFLQFAQDAVAGFTRGGQITHRIDGRHFDAPLQGTNWTVERGGTLGLLIGKVPEQQTKYAHPLVPLSAGLWKVGVEPPILTFADPDGKLEQIKAEHRPWLLKVTWFTLFWMLLPALLWVLAHVDFPKKKDVVEKLPLPELGTPSLPTRLPGLPAVDEKRDDPIPTLFIGLGGTGRRALAAVRGDLKQAHLGRAGQPYKFLWVDLDTKEDVRDILFDDWAGYPVQSVIAPPTIRQADRYLPDVWNSPDHLKWFPSSDYANVPRETLNLSEGVRGDRMLARLALFQWLSREDGLMPELVAQCEALEQFPSSDGVRQIVIVGSSEGGSGSGWFLDFGRLVSRITKRIQQKNGDFIPEVIGVLCNKRSTARSANLQALTMEVESALLSRAYPHRVTYSPGDPVLDKVDAENPYSAVFGTSSFELASSAAQCADLASVLVERHPRSSLMSQTLSLRQRQVVSAASHTAHVLPTQVYDSVRLDLFLRLLGPDILLDIVANEQGGYAPKPVTTDQALKLLERWAAAETQGEPLQLLLAAAIDSSLAARFVDKARTTSAGLGAWMGEAFIASLNRRLHGQGEVSGAWRRELMPSEAIVVLRLLVGRLEQDTKPELKAKAADATANEAVDQVIAQARTAADRLEKWVRDFRQICERHARQHTDLKQLRNNLARLSDREYLDLEPSTEQIDQWTKECLDSWLGTTDNIAAIRQRLFFEASATGVVVRSYVAEPRSFTNAEEAAKTVEELARSLAFLVPTARIEGALGSLPDAQRAEIATRLVNVQTTPRYVLLVSPKPTGTEAQRRGLEAFLRAIPQPLSHGQFSGQTGDDHSAIRRVELVELTVPHGLAPDVRLPLIEPAERTADIVRRRAAQKHSLDIPLFPAELRIALANADGFRSFARAYKAGQIVQQPDQEGRPQWALRDGGRVLTTGSENSLTSAAANYVWRIDSHPDSFATVGAGGDFSKLNQWSADPHQPDGDTIVQIAVDAYES